jgi:hypothetical protein
MKIMCTISTYTPLKSKKLPYNSDEPRSDHE